MYVCMYMCVYVYIYIYTYMYIYIYILLSVVLFQRTCQPLSATPTGSQSAGPHDFFCYRACSRRRVLR